jgi:hypothetical protein
MMLIVVLLETFFKIIGLPAIQPTNTSLDYSRAEVAADARRSA